MKAFDVHFYVFRIIVDTQTLIIGPQLWSAGVKSSNCQSPQASVYTRSVSPGSFQVRLYCVGLMPIYFLKVSAI